MRNSSDYLTTLRDIFFMTVCAGVFVGMAASALWVYSNYFAPKERIRRIAPEGVFYLQTYASARTPHGVVGIPAGERVERVNGKSSAGMVRVTDGQYLFDVLPSQLTDDLDVAEALGAADGEFQRRMAERATSGQRLAQQAYAQTQSAYANDVARWNAQSKSASVVGALVTPLNGGAIRQIGSGASPASHYFSNITTVNARYGGSTAAAGRTGDSGAGSSPSAPEARYTEDPMTRLHRAATAQGGSPTVGNW